MDGTSTPNGGFSPSVDLRDATGASIAVQCLVAIADDAVALEVSRSLSRVMPTVVRRVKDAAEVAAALHETSYDVVVADVDVEGFEDALILRLARDTQPTAVRIGILGRARDDVSLLPLAHQLLTPVQAADVGGRARHAVAMHRAIEHPIVRAQVANCNVLPGVPGLLAKLSVCLADPEATMADVADIVADDPELTARVLQLVNSAFFGRRTPTSDLGTAVAWLGTPAIRALVVHVEVLRSFRTGVPPLVQALANDVAVHGRETANWARELSPSEPEAWTAGLLHDLGKLVLAANDPSGWALVESMTAAGRPQIEAEQAVLGVSHAAVGACLFATWGLPEEVVHAVAGHHNPADAGTHLHLAGVVHLAGAVSSGRRSEVDEEWLERAGLTSWFDTTWNSVHP